MQACPLATTIDEMAPRAEPRENFVADGSGGGGELIDRKAFADEGRAVAAPNRAVRKVGNVDAGKVHRNVANDRAALGGNDCDPVRAAVVAARGAEQSVGVTQRGDGDPGRASG